MAEDDIAIAPFISIEQEPPKLPTKMCPTLPMLIHLFCTQKSISLKNEKLLMDILATHLLKTGESFPSFPTFRTFRKQLDALLNIEPNIILCRTKPPGYKNYKPMDPNKVGHQHAIPMYSIQTHLENFLNDPELSASVITRHRCDQLMYSDFTTGTYFRDLCNELPQGVTPLCCKSSLLRFALILVPEVELYWDDTGISTKKKCGPVWFGISNTEITSKRTTRSRMLLAVLPGNADPSAIFSQVVKHIEEIKLHSFFFACDGSSKLCHVTLSMVLGDAPASNSAIGKLIL